MDFLLGALFFSGLRRERMRNMDAPRHKIKVEQGSNPHLADICASAPDFILANNFVDYTRFFAGFRGLSTISC